MSHAGLGNTSSVGDGEYRTMPLEGRFDLMRRSEEPSEDSLPIPAQNEPLPSPKLHIIPLSVASEVFNTTTDSAPLISHHPAPQDYQASDPGHHVEQEPPRPSSPPKMLWNPAIEPPPTTAPSATAFPSDTYFPNIWDQPASRHHDQPHHPQQEESTSTETGTFFQPPPSAYIPAQLIQEGHYRQVIGDANHYTPEPTKVKSVFPWEEKPRHMPSRRFPDSDRPPPSAFASSEPVVESPPKAASPEPVELTNKSPSPPQVVSPGSPFSLTYANAWDGVPSIQKYAERLVRPPPPQVLAPAFDPEDYRRSRGNWEDRATAASEDGDDEDEGDDEQTPNGDRTRWDDDSDGEGYSKRKSRSRRDSDAVAATYIVKSKKKEYRVRGVQTVPREMRDQAVQVNIIDSSTSKVPHDHHHRKSSQEQSQPTARNSSFTRGNGRKQQWVPPTGALTPVVSSGPGAGPTSTTDFVASPTKEARSPREFAFSETPTTARLKQTATLSESTPLKRAAAASPVSTVASLSSSPSMTSRQLSHDGSSTASPPSSVGLISPPEGQSLLRMGRKSGRVFDPARGVEVFKQGSEEVLARFLRMSSWENDR
jgi:glycogenin